jgi:hypothetical protein
MLRLATGTGWYDLPTHKWHCLYRTSAVTGVCLSRRAPCAFCFKHTFPRARGGRKKTPEKPTYICASSQKQIRTYVRNFFFSAFLGVSRQGEFENTRKQIEYVSKKNHRGNIFSGGGFLFWVNFLTSFPSGFFVALVKRLSVRGTQKRDKKSFTGSCVYFPPPLTIF